MKKEYKRSIFLFHRDLRLQDNTGLQKALSLSEEVLPVFIFEKKQLNNNVYKSNNLVQFMFTSLQELEEELYKKKSQLILRHGDTHQELQDLIEMHDVEAVFFNRDYTPFAIQRDKKIKHLCETLQVECKQFGDALLHEPEEVFKKDGTPYTVYTPFMKTSRTIPVRKPVQNRFSNYAQSIRTKSMSSMKQELGIQENEHIFVHGGREEALKVLKTIDVYKDYKQERDIPALQATTRLSAHNKFGTISIREFYWKVVDTLGGDHTLINELYWRDFYTHIAFHFPKVFGAAYQDKYDSLKWKTNKQMLKAWQDGQTGFPIVDAGMRQLNKTGYMHNRVRMIVASFLTKDLHISWMEGEKYFAQKLVDYDPCVNNGSWQWAASTGTDAQPYFRIFNPWLQQKKFDPEALYIKKWIPELEAIEPKSIHQLFEKRPEELKDYPEPIVDHREEKEITLAMFKQ